jgi:ribonucleotide reductase beta subunit family protein with ferritin-like domain
MDATQLFESDVENRFKALYESQKKAVRFPEEINVQQDMHDWMALQNFFEVTPNQYTNS